MIPVKIQCGCGQRYAFEVEPINGRMGSTVACPVCGTDGTAAANDAIAQALLIQPQAAPGSGLALATAPPTAAATRAPAAPAPPIRRPIPQAAAPTRLAWYEQVWIALPLALVSVGGLIGGACGGLAWGTNKVVFKTVENPALKYLLTGLISASAVVAWLIFGSFFAALIHRL